jgi:hypothetical protein
MPISPRRRRTSPGRDRAFPPATSSAPATFPSTTWSATRAPATQLLPAEVERAYRRQLELGDGQPWPPPTGYWRADRRFVLTDGRNRYVACLMLGVEHVLVAWLVPLT